ncbi:unnamed protein product [Peniophora sp. CBMAI 1063]|nr:unnamed protein product [Peniophora sp. CBMAI 1063]
MDKHASAAREMWSSAIRSRFEVYAANAPSHPDSRHRTALADRELRILQEQLALARKLRNKTTGPCRLPPESLALVFDMLQAQWKPTGATALDYQSDGPQFETTYTSGWMAILHICSYWREVALSTSALWSRLDCLDLHPELIPTILIRSRGLPLTFRIDGSTTVHKFGRPCYSAPIPTSSWLYRPILRRLAHLEISNVPDEYLQSWLPTFRQSPMPLLRTICITGDTGVVEEEDDDHIARYKAPRSVIPGDTFHRVAPQLYQLYLREVRFSWTSSLFSRSVVELELGLWGEHEPDVQSCTPSEEQFQAALSSMPALKRLTLHAIFPPAPEDGHDPEAIRLPDCFEHLDVTCNTIHSIESCMSFMGRIALPQTAIRELNVFPPIRHTGDDILETSAKKLFTAMDEDLPARELHLHEDTVALEIGERPLHSLLLQPLYPDDCDDWEAPLGGRHPGGHYLRLSYKIHDRPLEILIPLLSLATLQTIVCTPDRIYELTANDWTSTFGTAKTLQRLCLVYTEHLGELFDALCEVEQYEDGTPHFALFPTLSTLVLHKPQDIDYPHPFSHMYKNLQFPEEREELRKELAASFLEALQIREMKGAPVKELYVGKGMSGWEIWKHAEQLVTVTYF